MGPGQQLETCASPNSLVGGARTNRRKMDAARDGTTTGSAHRLGQCNPCRGSVTDHASQISEQSEISEALDVSFRIPCCFIPVQPPRSQEGHHQAGSCSTWRNRNPSAVRLKRQHGNQTKLLDWVLLKPVGHSYLRWI
jgi:hypothetical protein